MNGLNVCVLVYHVYHINLFMLLTEKLSYEMYMVQMYMYDYLRLKKIEHWEVDNVHMCFQRPKFIHPYN